MLLKIPYRILSLLLASLLLISVSSPAEAGAINSRLLGMTAGADRSAEIGVIITFSERIDPQAFRHLPGKGRRNALVRALRDRAAGSQAELHQLLRGLGVRKIRSLWTINALSCQVRPELLDLIAAQPGVEEVRPDDTFALPPLKPQAAAMVAPEWNITAVGAPALWNLGLTGAGVVVASLDSGVDPDHADLVGKWRGGPHDWFDPYDQHATPFDNHGHGTAVMGLMVGGGAGATAIGVAPGATWIAAKIFKDSGDANYSAIHQAFAWVLDPDGDVATDDAPQVVNNSWNIYQIDSCRSDFQTDLDLLKEAGIAVVFSAGNDGPNLSTSTSPGNCPGNLAVGAINRNGAVSSFSSRGPSPCTPGQKYPSLVAPGERVRSSALTTGGSQPLSYLSLDGTSFAAPQVSGLLALLLGAGGFPTAPVADLNDVLEKSADDLGSVGADNNSGSGLVNGLAAYRRLAGLPHLALHDPTPPEFDRALSFSKLPDGSNLSRTLTIRNSGGGHLVLGRLDASALHPAFTVAADTCSNTTLAGDQACGLTVSFAPLAVGAFSGTLTLPSNDFDQNPLIISLAGLGNHPPEAATPLTPGNGAVGLDPASITLRWQPAVDRDGDTVSEQVSLREATSPGAKAQGGLITRTFPGPPLLPAGLAILAGLAACAPSRRWRSNRVALALLAAITMTVGACGGGGGEATPATTTTTRGTYTATNLKAATTYNWSVISTDSHGASSESSTWQFTTR